jgi:DNA ligase D-like protein (predicted 3'-phosphoesterase)
MRVFSIVLYVLVIGFVHCQSCEAKKGSKMPKKLESYTKKRSFEKTPEPKPKIKSSTRKNIFVIQQHHASHMHFDFRLEIDGVLKSWAVPKGPSTNPRVKRLAAQTEDHPLDYATFEGIIPEGYGAGTVIVWDTGTYRNLTEKNGKKLSMADAFEQGHIKIDLAGKKLKGGYALTHFKDKNWLLVKVADAYADARRNPVKTEPKSVLSSKTVSELDKQYKKQKKERDA